MQRAIVCWMEAVRAEEEAEVDLLGLGEQSGGLGRVGEDEGADDGEDHSGVTLDEAAGKVWKASQFPEQKRRDGRRWTCNSQRHPSIPWVPSSCKIPIASNPPNAFPIWDPE